MTALVTLATVAALASAPVAEPPAPGGRSRAADVRQPDLQAQPPLQKVLDGAAAAGQPVLLDVYATWCGPCRRLSEEVLPAPEVRRALGPYRMQRYDAERGYGRDVAHRFLVDSYPTLLVLNPDGVEVARIRARTVEGLARALDEWRPLGAVRGRFEGEPSPQDADAAALLVRGVLLDHRGQAARARALYDLAEAMDPSDARGLASRAAFRKLRQDLSRQFVRNRAGVLLEFARKYPGTELAARAVAAVAQIAPAQRPPESSVREVSAAVLQGVRSKKDALALHALSWSLLDLGFADLALEAAKGAQAAAPYELHHLVPEAAALDAAGRHEQAVALLEKGAKVDARNPAVRWALPRARRGLPLRRGPETDLFND